MRLSILIVMFGLGIIGSSIPVLAIANDQVGTLTQVQGEVKLFFNPGKVLGAAVQGAPHVLFEGVYYSVKDAVAGSSVEKGNILRTAVGAKARVVYPNGDQFNVGSGSAYRITWDTDSAKSKTSMDLMYGKIRGIVEKGGPRSKLTIRTKTASMGVRGTDFFIDDGGPGVGTQISVLRGQVAVKNVEKSATKAQAREVSVQAGQSADLPASVTPELRPTTQEELKSIQKTSTVKNDIKQQVAFSEKVTDKIKKLEAKAIETTVQDIKVSDPKLYAQIQLKAEKNEFRSVDDVNGTTVEQLVKVAPKAPVRLKPSQSELEDQEKDQYKKYFHSEEN